MNTNLEKMVSVSESIMTEKEYDNTLAHVYELMQTNIVEGSAFSDELETLSLLIKEFELVHYPVFYPNPVEAIKFPNATNEIISK